MCYLSVVCRWLKCIGHVFTAVFELDCTSVNSEDVNPCKVAQCESEGVRDKEENRDKVQIKIKIRE